MVFEENSYPRFQWCKNKFLKIKIINISIKLYYELHI